MTSPTSQEVATRRGRPGKPRSIPLCMAAAIEADLRRRYDDAANGPERVELAQALGLGGDDKWPSERYRLDPEAFAREVLGVNLWDRQTEIALAVRDHMRVAVASGHKVGKSLTDAFVAIWFYCCFEEARVIMSSVTSRQVDQILWREVRKLHRHALKPIGGELHELARSGLKAPDFREIVGFTAREAEAVAGISGKNLLYIIDEASGVPKDIFEAIEGNRAGGAHILLTSNPTQPDGEFFDAFHDRRETPSNPSGFHCIQISSEDSPNVRAGRIVIPGLATREWVEEKRREWGEESDLFSVRVKGAFVRREEGRVVSLHTIELAEQRWRDMVTEGGLVIGLDPAGDGVDGDETVYAPRRGLKVLELVGRRGLTPDGILVNLLGVIREHRVGTERVRVVLDREGAIGSEVYGTIKAYLAQFPEDSRPFEVIPIRASDRALRQADVWDRMRDALWGNLARWLRPLDSNGEGGAIPEHDKLAADLHAPEWIEGPHGRRKVTAKVDLRKKLGRSPDYADAIALAVWDAKPWEVSEDEKPKAKPLDRRPVLDPYGGAIDPYGRRR